MTNANAIELLFGGLSQLGPGSDDCTREALRRLPRQPLLRIVDAGCGTGRQTLVLASELKVPIDAVDTFQPFLERLAESAAAAGLAGLVRPQNLNLAELPTVFHDLDLIWSEGAIYNVGFERGLAIFARALAPGGMVAVTECTWLVDEPPPLAREFWSEAYPPMTSIAANCRAAESVGYRVLETFVLPQSAWTDGYYGPLAPRARALATHESAEVRGLAAGMLREIDVFEKAGESYGYVFYLLQHRGEMR
jgi:SAM-dependent methyltransferase